MNIPSSFFASGVCEKDILYFSSNYLSSTEPHYFICLKKTANDLLIFCVTSTQKEKILTRIQSSGLPAETVVHIKSIDTDTQSIFPKDCYVNCNNKFEFTVEQLQRKFESGEIIIKGQLPQRYYEEIVNGLCLSPTIENSVKKLFNHI